MSAENWHEADDFVTAYESLPLADSRRRCKCNEFGMACRFHRELSEGAIRRTLARINSDPAWPSWGREHMK